MDDARMNEDRPPMDRISFCDNDSDAEGWPYFILLGTDMDRGWTIEADMQGGKFVAAFTPAGVDPLFLMTAEEEGPEDHPTTTVRISVEGGSWRYDEASKTIVITNGEG